MMNIKTKVRMGAFFVLILALALLPGLAQAQFSSSDVCGGVSEKVKLECKCTCCGFPCDPLCYPSCYSLFREEIKTYYHEQEESITNTYTVDNLEKDINRLNKDIKTEIDVNLVVTRYKRGGVITSNGFVNYTLRKDIPDIFRAMSLTIGGSKAAYYKYLAPVKHELTKRKSSSGPNHFYTNYDDYYERQHEKYGFDPQCQEICPSPPRCTCPPGDIMSPLCLKEDISEIEYPDNIKDNLCEYFYPSMDAGECKSQKLPTENAIRDLCNRFKGEIGLSDCRSEKNEAVCYEKFTTEGTGLEQTLYRQCHGDLYFEERDDCVCQPPDNNTQCSSNRHYHEEEPGGLIVNGNFEMAGTETGRDRFGPWEPEGNPDIVWMGRNGHALYLEPGDSVIQRIPEGARKHPDVQSLCLEYGIYSNQGGTITVEIDGENQDSYKTEECTEDWSTFCIAVPPQPKTVEIRADPDIPTPQPLYVDNVNVGSYYDFTKMYIYNQERRESAHVAVPQSMGGLNRLMTTDYQEGIANNRKYHTMYFGSIHNAVRNPFSGGEGFESLTRDEVLNANVTIYTYFDEYLISPDVTIKDAMELSYELDPDKSAVYPGQRMTVTVSLSNLDEEAFEPNKRVYVWSAGGGKLANLNPSGLTLDNDKNMSYVVTDGSGEAEFSFDANSDISLRMAHLGSDDTGPTQTKALRIQVLTIDTTILSPNILLVLVLIVIAVFSYRLLKGERTRLEMWWEDFKGES